MNIPHVKCVDPATCRFSEAEAGHLDDVQFGWEDLFLVHFCQRPRRRTAHLCLLAIHGRCPLYQAWGGPETIT